MVGGSLAKQVRGEEKSIIRGGDKKTSEMGLEPTTLRLEV